NLTNEAAYTYRVWADPTGRPQDTPAGNSAHPHPTGTPDGFQAALIGQTDITVANYPFSMNDPWLPDGVNETVGNNVDAYSDLFYPNGLWPIATPATPATGDFRAQATGLNAFQHTYDKAQPHNHVSRMAAATQLFVDINFLHDWFYDSGFNEASGNAQQNNYGRGGLGNDRILAEAQDSSGRNNANMYTPADGASPAMQMYIFDGNNSGPMVNVDSPASIAGPRSVGTASVGPTTFEVTAEVVQPQPLTGCSALTNAGAVAGKIVLVDREPTSGADGCSLAVKLTNIAAAGPAGILVVNYSTWPDTLFNLSETVPGFNKPVLTMSWNGAAPMKEQLASSNTVTATMARPSTAIDRDGTLDNQIVAHEWGHYLSNRLIGNAAGLSTLQSRGMGEGWSDFLAMMLTVRADDTANPTNANFNGVYATGTYADSGGPSGGTNQGYYFGIRRAPYSTDFAKNPFTFKHIQHGVALPAGVPLQLNGGSNAQVHNTGEIWANMLWECYAALLRDTLGATPRLTFAQAQQRMKDYLVAGLKLTPVAPTFVEARDAILAAAAANDQTDFTLLFGAFAKRGLGAGAVAPDRFNGFNSPVVESFLTGGDAKLLSSTLTDAGGSCDNDGILDRGETGLLTITIKNTGTATLNGISGTVSVTSPGVTLPNGGAIVFPDVAPFQTTTATVAVAISSGATGIRTLQFSFQYAHASMTVTPQTATLTHRANLDSVSGASATDTVDAPVTAWTTTSGVAGINGPWAQTLNGAQSLWHVNDASVVTDERLESPPMTISAAGSFKLEFDHLFSFDYYYDGGVVEMSRNGGAWTDIGSSAYNGYIYYGSNGGNPLAGRSAFTGSGGPAHVALQPTVAAGDVVRIRFRIGTDYVVGAQGWDIDSISVSGILETPFTMALADPGCVKSTSTQVHSSANPSKLGTSVTLTGTVVGPGTPPGPITFFDGNSVLGTVNTVNRVAKLTTSSLGPGAHQIVARYDGTTVYATSSSPLFVQIVDDCSAVPAINFVSASTRVPVGTTVPLSVTATGSAGISYQWYAGTAGNTSTPVGSGANVNVTPFSTTSYWARATNGCGFVNSAAVTVTVIPPTRFYTITPCQIVDTRWYNNPIKSSEVRVYEPYWGCGMSSQAKAVSVNITVYDPTSTGWLALYSADVTFPGASTINYRAGRTRSNNAIIPLSATYAGGFRVFNMGVPVHFTIDVNGYFE
ncbi:MAG TPA: M36 family metallopeptidase, partial [Thermoanaerobaculia bacterium]